MHELTQTKPANLLIHSLASMISPITTPTPETHSLTNLKNMHTPFSNPILTPHPHLKRSNNAMHYPTARSMMDEIDLQLCLDIDPIVSPPPHIGCRLQSTKPSSVMESLFIK
jgi:hypothetical protein